MNSIRLICLSSVLVLASSAVAAAENVDHNAHHSATAVTTSARVADNAAMKNTMEKMDVQLKSMQVMHEKVKSAKTDKERSALMAEHMKTMQIGMAMMKDMPEMNGMSNMKKTEGMKSMKEGMPMDKKGDMKMMHDMPMDIKACHQMMEKRMAMMTAMMEMMMDRLPVTPLK